MTTQAAMLEAGTKVACASAAIAAAGALACRVCCVLPFALPAAMLAMSGSVLAWFGGLKPWVTTIALVTVAGGWLWVALQTIRTHRHPARSTLLTMIAATAPLAATLAWPLFERTLIALMPPLSSGDSLAGAELWREC